MFVEKERKFLFSNGNKAEITFGGILINSNGYLIKDLEIASKLLELDEEEKEIFLSTCKRYLPTILS